MPAAPSPHPDPTDAHPVDGSADHRPNRATRRGKRTGTVPAAASPPHARGGAPHARGAQGRRIIPVRRTG
jgi:hypothetical protein